MITLFVKIKLNYVNVFLAVSSPLVSVVPRLNQHVDMNVKFALFILLSEFVSGINVNKYSF